MRELNVLVKESRDTGEDIILGGIHPILGAKGAERGLQDYRCRVVFTAPRARTASGLDAHALYDEISSSPITFQASRTLRAYAALRGFVTSSRDAKSAYLQSRLRREGKTDPRTFVAIPRQFWPEEWVKAGMKRPMCPLELSLYGHPVSGNRWEIKMDESVKVEDFRGAPMWKATYKQNGTEAALRVYVDDFELHASAEDTPKIWARLEKHIEFKDKYQIWCKDPIPHLGCDYIVEMQATKTGAQITTFRAQMKAYFEDIVNRFEERMGVAVKSVETPWLDSSAEKRYQQELNEGGDYGWMAASPLMAGLYGARSARPDLVIATLQLARRLKKWTKFDDRRLLRYLGYMRWSAAGVLSGTFSTDDLVTAVLRIWPDADLAGDPAEDAKSTSGVWIEVASK